MLFLKKRKVLLLGFGLIALYWLLDAASDTFFFREGDFVTELFFPGPYCLSTRLLTSIIIAGFSFVTGEMLKRSASMKKEIELRAQQQKERTAELQSAINCLAEEINSRIKTEETLRENQEKIMHMHGMKVIGEMAAALAHEIRNPLQALTSVSEALQQEFEGNADVDIYLRHIHEQVQRLSTLMEDLLDLGKPVEPANLRRESLSEICVSAIDIWKNLPLGREHDVKLAFPGDHAGIHVIADGQRLQRVFLSLLDNAAYHCEKGRGIDMIIDGSDLKKMVKIRVVDCGSGIPEEFLPKIFDPFFSTRRGGTGLGLNIVKNIAESHGGFLLLSNNTPLPGCTAEVNLPVSE